MKNMAPSIAATFICCYCICPHARDLSSLDRQRITSQSQTKNDMNGILSWPETRPYAFDPWCDVFCESLAEFLRECVLGLLFLAFSFSASPVRTGRNTCLRFQESTDLAMPWSTNQGSQRCARRPTRGLPSPVTTLIRVVFIHLHGGIGIYNRHAA